MQWFIPISLLPGIALVILSTSNFTIALNAEIQQLNNGDERFKQIRLLKIRQLKRLSFAISGLYLSVLFFTISGLFAWLEYHDKLVFALLFLGILMMTASVVQLIIYSIRAIRIRTRHLQI